MNSLNPAALIPQPSGIGHFLEHQLRRFRRTWRGTIVGGLFGPVIFLLAIGVGLGSQIDSPQAELGTADYITFVGPGLMAVGAMTLGASESLWQTKAQLMWQGNYASALATPLTVSELVTGHVLWIGFRELVSALLYLGVLVIFGVVAGPQAILAPLAATLTAMAFAAPISAWTAMAKTEVTFPMILRLVVTPLFLFSGAFFPVNQLPGILPQLAKLTPSWHGVQLCRGLITDAHLTAAAALVHIVVLFGYLLAGWLACNTSFARELTA